MSASPSILANKDINVPTMNHMNSPAEFEKKAPMVADPHSMEYHRQVLQNKLEQKDQDQEKYISPSDTIMSPCTAKLSAYRNKQVGKNTKPRSLFAKTSAKKLSAKTNNGEMFGQDITPSKTQSAPNADIEMQD
ncbi:hypothetical protein CJF32_00004305 [Rutstroemia sp. NJR-2017a WRK4]|nr:hypothetical protein CJF32_00004305 [Rutstroemia sp. NJR-2017a WRK4]